MCWRVRGTTWVERSLVAADSGRGARVGGVSADLRPRSGAELGACLGFLQTPAVRGVPDTLSRGVVRFRGVRVVCHPWVGVPVRVDGDSRTEPTGRWSRRADATLLTLRTPRWLAGDVLQRAAGGGTRRLCLARFTWNKPPILIYATTQWSEAGQTLTQPHSPLFSGTRVDLPEKSRTHSPMHGATRGHESGR